MEVNQQTYFAIRKLQVGEQLSLMNWHQVINGFNFDNHYSFDEKIQSVTTVQPYLSIDHRQRFLSFHL